MKPTAIGLAVLALGSFFAPAETTEITLIAPVGIKAAIEQLLPGFERGTGYKVKPTFVSGLTTKKRVADGEAFDVPVLQPPYPEVLASGNVDATTATPLAEVAVGVAVRKGALHPDISTAEAVKRALLQARSISYPDPSGGAAAGVSFEKTLQQLGIAKEMEPKIRRAAGGYAAMALLAKGDVELGLTFQSEMNDPGIESVGTLPREISTPTSLVGFVSTRTKHAAAARELLRYLSSPDAAATYRAVHMRPLP